MNCAVPMAVRHAPPSDFKQAMRALAGGVSVVTVQAGAERSGFTATSVVCLSIDPPTLLVCVNRSSSSAPLVHASRRFGVSVLTEAQQPMAERFAGMGACGERGSKGHDRYTGAAWERLTPNGALVMTESAIALDCYAEDIIEKYSHWILIGRVQALRQARPQGGAAAPLLYWNGAYRKLESAPG